MYQHKDFGFDLQWYEQWMQQSKTFFESANANLGNVFTQGKTPNPEDHLTAIQQWLEMLKTQWSEAIPTNEQASGNMNWKVMSQMCQEAANMLLEQWIKRTKSQEPINNVRDLYELWLQCCQSVYQKSLRTESFQTAYGEWMNAALKWWRPA
jgi:hypothetical protein